MKENTVVSFLLIAAFAVICISASWVVVSVSSLKDEVAYLKKVNKRMQRDVQIKILTKRQQSFARALTINATLVDHLLSERSNDKKMIAKMISYIENLLEMYCVEEPESERNI